MDRLISCVPRKLYKHMRWGLFFLYSIHKKLPFVLFFAKDWLFCLQQSAHNNLEMKRCSVTFFDKMSYSMITNFITVAHVILIPSVPVNHDTEWNDWNGVNPWSTNPQNCQTHSKNSSATIDELFGCIWPFFEVGT